MNIRIILVTLSSLSFLISFGQKDKDKNAPVENPNKITINKKDEIVDYNRYLLDQQNLIKKERENIQKKIGISPEILTKNIEAGGVLQNTQITNKSIKNKTIYFF